MCQWNYSILELLHIQAPKYLLQIKQQPVYLQIFIKNVKFFHTNWHTVCKIINMDINIKKLCTINFMSREACTSCATANSGL